MKTASLLGMFLGTIDALFSAFYVKPEYRFYPLALCLTVVIAAAFLFGLEMAGRGRKGPDATH
jgi:hypothetical protein